MKYNLVCYQSDNKENPGFFASKPVRGATRGRAEDTLILQILAEKNSPYWQSNLGKITREASRTYYNTPGSVTNAMRNTAQKVNHLLRIQNSGLRLEKSPETASMMLGVLRDGALYLGQAGYAGALLVSGVGSSLFYDEEIQQKGLGLTDLVDIRFFKTDFFGGDFLLMGLPAVMKVFERELPTPNSVIRLVNETKDLSSAFSLTKIAVGEGNVEHRMLSLAMLLDEKQAEEPSPKTEEDLISELAVDQTMDETTPEEANIESPAEVSVQLQLPMEDFEVNQQEDLDQVDEADFEASEQFLSSPQEEIHEEPQGLDPPDVVIDRFRIDDAGQESTVIPQEAAQSTDAVEDHPSAMEEGPSEPGPKETVDEAEDRAAELDITTIPEADQEVVSVQEEYLEPDLEPAEEREAVIEVLSQYQDEDSFETETGQSPEEKSETETVPESEPDLAAIARQERLERLKQGALTSIARGAGWLRGVEESAQVTVRRAEQKAVASGQELPALSPFTKWMIVILVPLLVVAIAVSVYFTRGLDRQYVNFINQARTQMQSAEGLEDPDSQRQAWVQAILWLNQAREFNQGDTSEIISLRNEAQKKLDEMDGVSRILFQNAFGKTVYPDLEISHIVPSQQAIFVLDKNSGRVLRFYRAGDSFLPDNKFMCGPGSYGEMTLGPIIDITDIPGNSPNNALVMGIDAEGKVIYCSDSGKSQIVVQLVPPEGGLGSVDAIHYGNDGLYLLDKTRSQIWVYRGLTEEFPDEPNAFVDETEVDLTGAVDIAVRREGLFVLFDDGKVAFSDVPYYSGFVEAHTQGPQPKTIQGQFSQISGLPVTDNRLYFLEPNEPAIGRYTYRLVFNDVLKVSFGEKATPTRSATAMAVSSSQTAFLAFGGQLFFAQLP